MWLWFWLAGRRREIAPQRPLAGSEGPREPEPDVDDT